MFRPLLSVLALGLTVAAIAQDLDDPMRPTGRSAEKAQLPGATAPARSSNSWRLDATVIRPGANRAVINGKPVQVGDVVNSARVTEILPGRVWLKRDDHRFDIVIADALRASPASAPSSVKKPSTRGR